MRAISAIVFSFLRSLAGMRERSVRSRRFGFKQIGQSSSAITRKVERHIQVFKKLCNSRRETKTLEIYERFHHDFCDYFSECTTNQAMRSQLSGL